MPNKHNPKRKSPWTFAAIFHKLKGQCAELHGFHGGVIITLRKFWKSDKGQGQGQIMGHHFETSGWLQNVPYWILLLQETLRLDIRHHVVTVADPGFGGRGAWIVPNKGEALVRGTKWRAGGGSGRGVSPLPLWKKMEIRKCLEDFWSTLNPYFVWLYCI